MKTEEILKLAKEIENQRSKTKHKRPYNVFTAWRMSENDHTKMLLALLRFQDSNGRYPLLNSFLNTFAKGRDKMIHYQHFSDVNIRFNPRYDKDAKHSFIDGLVLFSAGGKRIAIIIENKIFDAPDQQRQIRRYINHMTKDENIALENVWVFYITGNGLKEVDKISYDISDEDVTTNIGRRFVALNYESDIVGWLKESVLKARIYPESLTSVVRAYVEHLEGDLFCEDDSEAWRKDFLCKKLIGHHNLNNVSETDLMTLYSFLDEVAKYKKGESEDCFDRDELDMDAVYNLYRLTQEVIRDIEKVAFDDFEKCSANILNNQWKKELKKIGTVWKVEHRGTKSGKNGYVQVRCVDEWGTAHLEWCQLSTRDMLHSCKYIIELHVEGNNELAKQWQGDLMKNPILLPSNAEKTKSGTSKIFRLSVSTDKPLAKMSHKQLEQFLTNLYTQDLNYIFRMLLEGIYDYRPSERRNRASLS